MAAGAEENRTMKFHHKCGENITLSENNTTASEGPITLSEFLAFAALPVFTIAVVAGVGPEGLVAFMASVAFVIYLPGLISAGTSTVFSSVPIRQLHGNRFIFKQSRTTTMWQVGVTVSDPADLLEIPEFAWSVPQTWCVDPRTGARYENSSMVDTVEGNEVTQQVGDVWCVEVTPDGQVYIYHNYSQPWGSPVFTLPPDTTKVWAVVTLGWASAISLVQDRDEEIVLELKTAQHITDAEVHAEKVLEVFRYAKPMFDDMTDDTKTRIMSIIFEICVVSNSQTFKNDLLREGFIALFNKKLRPSDIVKIIKILAKDVQISLEAKHLKAMLWSWEIQYDNPYLTHLGTLLELMTFLFMCAKNEPKLLESSGEFDSILGPLVNQTLKFETPTSINSRDELHLTPLLHAAHMFLPTVIKTLLLYPGIDVNVTGEKEQTPLMILVGQGQQTDEGRQQDPIYHPELVDLIDLFTQHEQFDPNVQDIKGNTVLFYMSAHLIPSDFHIFVRPGSNINWDYSKRNKDGFRILDYYDKQPNCNQAVLTRLAEACENNSSSSDNKRPVFMNERPINMIHENIGLVTSNYSCTPNFFASKTDLIQEEMVYELTKAKKGKMLLISLTEFMVDWLCALPGYDEDKKNLTQFWSDVGFDVFCPTTVGPANHQLTAKEIQNSIRSFADMLEVEDQCAVLAILTHGGDGYIHGSDGRKVYIRQMLAQFDNRRCIKMAGKPKIIIIQACQGASLDMGVHQRAAPSSEYKVAAAVEETHLPQTSDMIVCYPSMSGYASFVRNTTVPCSIFINCLMETFKQRIGTDDIYTILTMVNREMCREGVEFPRSGTAELQKHKQMSRFESCLTKLLFFFPAAGGKTGHDWK